MKYYVFLVPLMVAVQPIFAGGLSKVDIKKAATERLTYVEELYHDLHQAPELSGKETLTATRMAKELKAIGLDVKENIGGTGLVGILKNGVGPTTIVRTELDALPVPEDTGFFYKSKVNGVMHACGHDVHMASLVGTASAMIKLKNSWHGTIIFLAQPAEETVKGAKAMIDDGLFKKIPKADQVLALHVSGIYPEGQVAVCQGFVTANSDSIDVKFIGKGTHGSMPYKGIDPFTMAAEFVLRVQTLVGREVDPLKPAVISVGSIHGGAKNNIIPDEVKLQLTVRSYGPETRELLLRRIKEIAEGIAQASAAAKPVVEHPEETPSVYNDPTLTKRMEEVFVQALGRDRVKEVPPVMAGEDVGRFGTAISVPTLFFNIGTQTVKDGPINHSPRYAPNFKPVAEAGMTAMIAALLDLHGVGAK